MALPSSLAPSTGDIFTPGSLLSAWSPFTGRSILQVSDFSGLVEAYQQIVISSINGNVRYGMIVLEPEDLVEGVVLKNNRGQGLLFLKGSELDTYAYVVGSRSRMAAEPDFAYRKDLETFASTRHLLHQPNSETPIRNSPQPSLLVCAGSCTMPYPHVTPNRPNGTFVCRGCALSGY